MDILSYIFVTLVFIVIIYLLFIKKDKVEDEDDILVHNDENNTYDTMLELKNKNDILEEKVNKLEKELSKYKEENKKVYNNDIQNKSKASEEELTYTKHYHIIYFFDKNFKKIEQGLKKCNMLAYKKLKSEYYPSIENGNFIGKRISKKNEHILKYELMLPSDPLFSKIYGDCKLIYSVYPDEKTVVLETIQPEDILIKCSESELAFYKKAMVSKKVPEKDLFKIDLLNKSKDNNEGKDIDDTTLDIKMNELSNQVKNLNDVMDRILDKNGDMQNGDMGKKTKNGFTITYSDEKKYRRLERNIKKYNMLAYKKLVFEYYPSIENGNYVGELVKEDNNIFTYELVLPTDSIFSKVYRDLKLIYGVNMDEKNIIFETIEPENILLEGYKNEITTYKGVMISKEYRDRDIFKINLLNMLENDNERKDK